MDPVQPPARLTVSAKKITRRYMLGHNQACRECRSRHKGCDGARPVCGPCQRNSGRPRCVFDTAAVDPSLFEDVDTEARLLRRIEQMETRFAELERSYELSRHALQVVLRAAPWLYNQLQPSGSAALVAPAAYAHLVGAEGVPAEALKHHQPALPPLEHFLSSGPAPSIGDGHGASQPPPPPQPAWFRPATPAARSSTSSSGSGGSPELPSISKALGDAPTYFHPGAFTAEPASFAPAGAHWTFPATTAASGGDSRAGSLFSA